MTAVFRSNWHGLGTPPGCKLPARPSVPNDLVWLPHEPFWQEVVDARLTSGLLSFNVDVRSPVTSLMTKLIRANEQLPHARLHDLRHLHATTLLLSGVPVHVAAARLGHADPAIIFRVYAHLIRSAEAAAADIFAQAVKAA